MRDPLAFPGLTRREVVGDALIGVLFGLVAVPLHGRESIGAGLVALLVAVALACRRSAPTVMMLSAVVSAAMQVVSEQVAVLPSLAYAVLFHTVGGHPDRRVRSASLVAGIVGVVVATTVLQRTVFVSGPSGEGVAVLPALFGAAAAAVVVIGGWATGFIRYQRQTVERSRTAAAIAELERRRVLDLYDEQAERARLARDMHDVVAHSLAVVVAQAEGARYTLTEHPETARAALEVIAETAREALGDVRSLLDELRGGLASENSAAGSETVRDDRRRLIERVRAAGMTVDLRETGNLEAVDPATAVVVHSVLTEALTNALKYGDLTQPVRVTLDCTRGVRLAVRSAVASSAEAPGTGYGLLGMRERAARVGGSASGGPTDDGGWLVTLVVPDRPVPRPSPTRGTA